MPTKLAAFLMAFFCLGALSCQANDKVLVALYLAENTPPAANATLAPEKLGHRLHQVFGFKYYTLMKSGEINLKSTWEQWVLPRKDFFIRLEPLSRKPGMAPLLDYELYKDGFIVAKGKYEPREGIPLFINGPDFKQGRLVFVLEAR